MLIVAFRFGQPIVKIYIKCFRIYNVTIQIYKLIDRKIDLKKRKEIMYIYLGQI